MKDHLQEPNHHNHVLHRTLKELVHQEGKDQNPFEVKVGIIDTTEEASCKIGIRHLLGDFLHHEDICGEQIPVVHGFEQRIAFFFDEKHKLVLICQRRNFKRIVENQLEIDFIILNLGAVPCEVDL